ncbi:hypothetical protein L7F22_028338 [Adiantum nelumboides]|nr:hypothetical protein [Adiantum nelumboides]
MWKEAEEAKKQHVEEETERRVQEALKATFGSSKSSKSPLVSPPTDESSPSPPQSPSSPIDTPIEDLSSSPKQISSVEQPQKIPSPEPQQATLLKIDVTELPRARPDQQRASEVVKAPQRDIFSSQPSVPFILEQLEVQIPNPSSSSFDKSYGILELESGDLEIHLVFKSKEDEVSTIQEQLEEVVENQGQVPPNAVYTAVQEKKLLLKLAQPPNFKGEGVNVERNVEVWLEAMDDYFEAAGTHPQNQTMLAMFRLTGYAKIWWKTHCRDSDIIGASQTWEQIKDAVTARYLPPAHKATKMNKFFSLRQLSSTLEEYYSKFVTLRRYAPKMTLEQQVARFCQGLMEPLNNRLEALRPTTLQDALLRAKLLAKEIKETTQCRHDYPSRRARLYHWNNGPTNQAYQSRPVVATTTAIEFPNSKSAIVPYIALEEQLVDMALEQATSKAILKVEISQFSTVVVDGEEYIFLHDLEKATKLRMDECLSLLKV